MGCVVESIYFKPSGHIYIFAVAEAEHGVNICFVRFVKAVDDGGVGVFDGVFEEVRCCFESGEGIEFKFEEKEFSLVCEGVQSFCFNGFNVAEL